MRTFWILNPKCRLLAVSAPVARGLHIRLGKPPCKPRMENILLVPVYKMRQKFRESGENPLRNLNSKFGPFSYLGPFHYLKRVLSDLNLGFWARWGPPIAKISFRVLFPGFPCKISTFHQIPEEKTTFAGPWKKFCL